MLNWAQEGSFSCNETVMIESSQKYKKWEKKVSNDIEYRKDQVKTECGSK